MTKEQLTEQEKAIRPLLQLSPEDTRKMEEAAQSIAAVLPQLARQFVEELSAYNQHRSETEERIKRGGRRTNGRILG